MSREPTGRRRARVGRGERLPGLRALFGSHRRSARARGIARAPRPPPPTPGRNGCERRLSLIARQSLATAEGARRKGEGGHLAALQEADVEAAHSKRRRF